MSKSILKFIITGFYSGKSKYFPGTCGTIVGVFLFYFLLKNSFIINLVIVIFFYFISIILLNYAYSKSIFEIIDDRSIVIDEVFGFFSFMIFFAPNFTNILLGFTLFRFFDIFKPFPIYVLDRKFKNSFGIMTDDLIAGIYSGLILYLYNNVL